jgi:hypothetical protein
VSVCPPSTTPGRVRKMGRKEKFVFNERRSRSRVVILFVGFAELHRLVGLSITTATMGPVRSPCVPNASSFFLFCVKRGALEKVAFVPF